MTPALLLLSMIGCDTLGPLVAKFVPVLEMLNEEWAPIDMECDQMYASRTPKRCLTAEIKCGDEIKGNNKMGRSTFDDDFYRGATCFAISAEGGHSGPELVYRLNLAKKHTAVATLVSDCADLDIFTMRWNDRDLECPGPQHAQRVGECQDDMTPRGGRVTMSATGKAETYLIAIDGKSRATGNFHLKVECDAF